MSGLFDKMVTFHVSSVCPHASPACQGVGWGAKYVLYAIRGWSRICHHKGVGEGGDFFRQFRAPFLKQSYPIPLRFQPCIVLSSGAGIRGSVGGDACIQLLLGERSCLLYIFSTQPAFTALTREGRVAAFLGTGCSSFFFVKNVR